MVWNPLSTKGQGVLDHEGGGLVGQNFIVRKNFKFKKKKEGKSNTMDGRRHLKPFHPNLKLWCVMDAKHDKCVPIIRYRLSGWLWCGA